MVDIKTLVEEAKAAARKHAPNARKIIEAIDALAEAHQAEVARLTRGRAYWLEIIRRLQQAVGDGEGVGIEHYTGDPELRGLIKESEEAK